MTITLSYLSVKFDKYNNLYFDGKLRKPTFRICNVRSYLGQYKYNNDNGLSQISMSTYYDRCEHDVDNTLIHEMIHLYQVQFDFEDKGHGYIFQRECDRINQYGWELSRVDRKVYELSSFSKSKIKNNIYHVCYYKELEGTYFVFVMGDKYVDSWKRYFKKRPIHNAHFFDSDNTELYGSFPKCRTNVRGDRVNRDGLLKYIK